MLTELTVSNVVNANMLGWASALAPTLAHLDALVAGTSRHSAAVKIVRDIVDEIFMVSGDAASDEHDSSSSSRRA